jgi:ActR/RegA family two-component response regulator
LRPGASDPRGALEDETALATELGSADVIADGNARAAALGCDYQVVRETMPAKILFVDDESAVLAGYERALHRDFEVDTAVGGELGLQAMLGNGPYAVVISDMRMPGMSGAQFLAKARKSAPDTVRMLLTGYTDLGAAMEAVNEGNIFRFLTKPCGKEILVPAINAGVEQNELIRSEKELLEQTLLGSIKVLADVLGAASPEAFGRSLRIAQFVRHIASKFTFAFPWRLEAAAALSQLGFVTLDADLIQKCSSGEKLSQEDQAHFETHPRAGMHLLAGIPRLEATAWMIGQQLRLEIPTQIPTLPEAWVKETVLGARVLKLAVAFDHLRNKRSDEETINILGTRRSEFGGELVDALSGIKTVVGGLESRKVSVLKLATGMFLDQDVRNKQGMLLMAKGQEITGAVLLKLENFAKTGVIDKEVQALVPG